MTYSRTGRSADTLLFLSAAVLYTGGVFGVTMLFNVPLNNSLAGVAVESATQPELHTHRVAFEVPWNRWHAVRTACAVLALVAALVPLVRKIPLVGR